ncbi:hypothetical protein ANN_01581 [Periplaneta americana]|uniref:Uncharacterized protein n=1 Tax=Periplaneta americana TaxID=6978 RepID=A0ABQ8TU11_PERAM|nr:hypothetical protein ANN_01581 [Periplaneta americana]
MNPFQNLWAAVKRILRSNWAEQPPVRTPEELWDGVLDAWEEMVKNLDLFHNLVDSIPRRMRAVVDSEPDSTTSSIPVKDIGNRTSCFPQVFRECPGNGYVNHEGDSKAYFFYFSDRYTGGPLKLLAPSTGLRGLY